MTRCARCGHRRWPFGAWAEPYSCARCRAVVAGKKNVKDPLGEPATPEQLEALAAGRAGRAARAAKETT